MVFARSRTGRARAAGASLVLLFSTAAVSACGGADASSPPQFEVDLGRFTISPATLTVPAGEVELLVTNTDNMIHNLVVAGRGTRNLQPGESQTITVNVAVASYRMWCDMPGHAAMGQTATMLGVDAPAATPSTAG